LLIDNVGGHNCLTNVKDHFLPPNCTSVIQPLDQGITHAFKNKYRKLIVKFMLLCAEEEREYTPIKTQNKQYRKLIVKFMLLCAEEEREYTPIKTQNKQ